MEDGSPNLIGLGTAQFGLNYGIANEKGKIPVGEARAIIDLASQRGVSLLDTAPAYGDSEEVIGKITASSSNFDIVTKIIAPGFATSEKEYQANIEEVFRRSLNLLRRDVLYAVLVHNVNDLLGPRGDLLMRSLLEIQDEGLVKKIGVSIYDVSSLEAITSRYQIQLVQVPFNVFDQRFVMSGWPSKLRSMNIEIHVRSIFLQGLLLMNPNKLPASLIKLKGPLGRYKKHLESNGMSPIEAAFGYVANCGVADRIIVGVDSEAQLREILSSQVRAERFRDFDLFSVNDDLLVNPSNWNLKEDF